MSKLKPEEVMEMLSPDSQYRLGCLAEQADESLVGYTLDSLPYGTRSALQAYEAVEESGVSGEFDYCLRFTRFGRKVAEACFRRHEGYIRYKWSEFETVKARREAAKLPGALQETLYLIAASSREFIESFIIMMPRADRELLKENGVIDTNLEGPLDDPVWVALTPWGRQVINGCAYLQLPEDAKQRLKKFDDARRELWEYRFRNTRPSRLASSA